MVKKTIEITKILCVVFIFFFTIVGLLSVGLLTIGWDNALGKFTEMTYNSINEPEREEIRKLTMDLTRACSGNNSSCYAKELYYKTNHIRYKSNSLHQSIHSPLYTYKNGGDCDNLANMYVEMLKSVGIKSHLSCSTKFRHCVAVVPHISKDVEYDKKFIVDLANNLYLTIDKNKNEWDIYGKKV